MSDDNGYQHHSRADLKDALDRETVPAEAETAPQSTDARLRRSQWPIPHLRARANRSPPY